MSLFLFYDEAHRMLEIQKKAFAEDLKRYQDHNTNPVNEQIERLLRKIESFYTKQFGLMMKLLVALILGI